LNDNDRETKSDHSFFTCKAGGGEYNLSGKRSVFDQSSNNTWQLIEPNSNQRDKLSHFNNDNLVYSNTNRINKRNSNIETNRHEINKKNINLGIKLFNKILQKITSNHFNDFK